MGYYGGLKDIGETMGGQKWHNLKPEDQVNTLMEMCHEQSEECQKKKSECQTTDDDCIELAVKNFCGGQWVEVVEDQNLIHIPDRLKDVDVCG